MADYSFQDVMRHWARMCRAMDAAYGMNSCDEGNCLLGGFRCPVVYEIEDVAEVDWEKYASRVMKWAKENPEPVYPTWLEWLEQQGLVETVHVSNGESHLSFKYGLAGTPMPAELAKPLKLKPKLIV